MKVRICVAVAADGQWFADGRKGAGDYKLREGAADFAGAFGCGDDRGAPLQYRWITAEVPDYVPAGEPEVEASAVEVEG